MSRALTLADLVRPLPSARVIHLGERLDLWIQRRRSRATFHRRFVHLRPPCEGCEWCPPSD